MPPPPPPPYPALLSAGPVSFGGGPLVSPAGRAAFEVEGLVCASPLRPGSAPEDSALSSPTPPPGLCFPVLSLPFLGSRTRGTAGTFWGSGIAQRTPSLS